MSNKSSETTISRTSEVSIKVHLNEHNLPLEMDWDATDSPIEGRKNCKAMLLSMWDGEAKNALRIDLWTKEMRVDEMEHFFFQTLSTMADTYARATQKKEVAMEMKRFAHAFGKKSGVLKK